MSTMRHIRHWISRRDSSLVPKYHWHMPNRMVTWSMTSSDRERSNSWPQYS